MSIKPKIVALVEATLSLYREDVAMMNKNQDVLRFLMRNRTLYGTLQGYCKD